MFGNIYEMLFKNMSLANKFKENTQSMGYKEAPQSHNEVSEGTFKRPLPLIDKKPEQGTKGVVHNLRNLTMNQANKPNSESIPGSGSYMPERDKLV